MRYPLSFAGYLGKYLRELSYAQTLNLQVLAEEYRTKNKRLREPLLLYCVFSGKAPSLRAASVMLGLQLDDEANAVYDKDGATLSAWLASKADSDLMEYRKFWNSYQVEIGKTARDNEVKAVIRQKILAVIEGSGVSAYRLYKETGLNPGNVAAWLKHGDPNKVSLVTARELLACARALAE